MKNILLCSSDPILIKNLYGLLRDEGYEVETVDHQALAVRKVISGSFDALIIDPVPFGLAVEDAVQIVRAVKPGMPVIRLDEGRMGSDRAATQPDLERLKRTIHSIAV